MPDRLPVHVDDLSVTVLEIRADPHLNLWSIDEVRISRVRDEQDQAVKLTEAILQAVPAPAEELLIDEAGRAVPRRYAWHVPVLLPGLPPLMEPRELSGVVTARFVLHQACVTIPTPLAATGRTVMGMRGVTLTVQKVERSDDGTATFVLRLEDYARLLNDGPDAYVRRIRAGFVAKRTPLAALLDGFELHDSRGRLLPRSTCERVDGPGPGVHCRVVFNEVPADALGLQLVLAARVIVRTEVEFAVR